MRKTFLLCLFISLLASCVKPEGDNGLVVINVGSLDVKSCLNGKSVEWQSGDELSVFDANGNNLFTTSQSGASVSFTGNADNSDSYMVLYPYSASASYDGTTIKTLLPSEQQIVSNSFARGSNISVGCSIKSGSTHSVSMKNIGCYLKFTVESSSSEIIGLSVEAIGGENIAGAVNVAVAEDGVPYVGTDDIVTSVTAVNGSEIFPAGTYYLTMLPSVLSSGIRVTVSMQNGTTRKYDLTGLTQTNRNEVYVLTTPVDYDILGVKHEDLASTTVIWENVKPHVRLSVNKDDGRFAKNEKIVFSGKIDYNDNIPLAMSVYEEGLLVNTVDIELNSTDKVLLECSSDTAKSFIIYVHPRGDSSKSLYIGAVVAADEFKPGFEMPSDFLSYWDQQKTALRASTPIVTLTPCEVAQEDKATIDCWALEISMPEGNPARGYLAMPKTARDGKLPIFIYLHGAGVKQPAHVDNAVKYAKMGDNGVIAIDMNAHGMLDGQPDSYYNNLNNGELNKYWIRSLTTRQDYYFRLMCLRMVRVLDYLCTLPAWDGQRVMSFGSSQGGYQALAIAGLDSRVRFALIDVPAHTDIGSPLEGRKAAWPGIYDLAIDETPELINEILPYFDGANFLRNTTAKVVCEAGLVDMTCPPGCVFAGFNVCPSSDKTIYSYPYRNHTAADMPDERVYDWKVAINNKKNKFMQNYLK